MENESKIEQNSQYVLLWGRAFAILVFLVRIANPGIQFCIRGGYSFVI